MGRECVKIYGSFEWAPAIEADPDNGILARPAKDRHDLDTVFTKFDRHFGVHLYRNIKRQEFLHTKRGSMSIMDFIAALKRKAEHCQYGDHKEGFICDMVINGVNDAKCSEKLMEIPADELTLDKVIKICRQVELTSAHLKSINAENPNVNIARTQSCDIQKARGTQLSQPGKGKRVRFHRPPKGRGRGQRSYTQANVHFAQDGLNYNGMHLYANSENYHDMHIDTSNTMNEMCKQCTVKDVFTTNTNSSDTTDEWKVKLGVENQKFCLEIDTGAMCNVLSKQMADRFNTIASIENSDTIINGISGQPTKAYEKIKLPCNYKGMTRNLEFQI
ncbi:hypothetical protein KUTeg_012164 [Tegillarca granosa]|uniref:Retrotransposon gag domain-containing protein n=1 Tax=Tegillarca granosa TaxID=220873 RepID=A0ABQ9EYR1_TEGGR|nr:hypothetical protein KUTeg_012164 [Tegillarca granosa]